MYVPSTYIIRLIHPKVQKQEDTKERKTGLRNFFNQRRRPSLFHSNKNKDEDNKNQRDNLQEKKILLFKWFDCVYFFNILYFYQKCCYLVIEIPVFVSFIIIYFLVETRMQIQTTTSIFQTLMSRALWARIRMAMWLFLGAEKFFSCRQAFYRRLELAASRKGMSFTPTRPYLTIQTHLAWFKNRCIFFFLYKLFLVFRGCSIYIPWFLFLPLLHQTLPRINIKNTQINLNIGIKALQSPFIVSSFIETIYLVNDDN